MFGSKSAFASAGVIGAVVAVMAGILQMIGYSVSDEDRAALVEMTNNGFMLITSLMTLVGGVVALWGRIRATKQITGVVHAPPTREVTAAQLNAAELERLRQGGRP